MRNIILIFVLLALMLSMQCPNRSAVKTELTRLKIIYITDWNPSQAVKIASLIKSEKTVNSTIVLLNSPIFTAIAQAQHQLLANILNASQIDACLITPDFMTIGIINCQKFIGQTNFYCLGANLKIKSTNQNLGQEYLIKPIQSLKFAVLGVIYDTLNPRYLNPDCELRSPEFTVLKLMPLVKNRSDFLCLLTQSNDTLDFDVNLILGAPATNTIPILSESDKGIFKIEIGLDSEKNIVEIKRNTLNPDNYSNDSIITKIINEYNK